ncbi:MAG: SDR family oxidoreductase [Desulfobacteraceae bacterium]|nr:SDR family oxidoreductase [Desulfobacteraceae bacterium]
MNLPYFDLSGKVAMITGGATGIGKGIAQGLAEAGAKVVIIARRLDVCEKTCLEIQEKSGADSFAYCCDITNSKAIKDTVEKTIQSCGHIDILVNNAGIGGSEKPILKMTDQDWDSVINTNLKSVFTLTREVVTRMVEEKNGGKIINIASIGAHKGWPNMSAYCAAKAGCVQLTKVMALEWATKNIQANAILPGYFETPMNTHFFNSDEGKKIIRTDIPVKRLAQIEEIKGVAILLASKASSFMTGSSIVIDGGQTSR